MKIIHAADLHLGVENYGKQDPTSLTNSRVLDFFHSLDYLIMETISQKADLLLISGDIYHHREPSPFIQNEFSKRIIRLSDQNIPLVLLIGNHDSLLAVKHISSLQIFSELRVPNLIIIDEPRLQTISTKSGPIQIAGIPFLEPSNIREYAINQELQDKEKIEVIETVFDNIISSFLKELSPKIPSILTAHLTLKEATYQNWRPVMIGNEISLSEKVLRRKGFSYVALGHIHKPQIFETDKHLPKAAYPGSLDVLDFGEAEYEHGFLQVDIEKNTTNLTFCPIPKQRKLSTLEVTGETEEEIMKKLENLFLSGVYENDIVRLVIITQSSIDEQKIRREMSSDCYLISTIRYERKKETTTRIEQLTNEMNPIDSIKQFLSVQKDSYYGDNQDKLIELTTKLLGEIDK